MQSYLPTVSDRPILFAIVGCGRIAKNHFDALQQHTTRATLVGVCDIDHTSGGNITLTCSTLSAPFTPLTCL